MNKTSPRSGAGTAGVKLHKKDDARQAANAQNRDFTPLIRILDDAILHTGQNDRSPVLYLKHDAKHEPFITTDYKDPRQPLSKMQGDLRTTQYVAAATLVCVRAEYWMGKLPDQPKVKESARAVIDYCRSSDSAFNRDGTYASTLRGLLQDLNDALNPRAPSTDAESPGQDPSKEKEEKKDNKEKGKSWFSRRSHKHPPGNTAPQAASQPTSPRSPPTTASNSLNVSPRAPDVSFTIQPPLTLADPSANSVPPSRPLPPLPVGATGPRSPGTNTAARETQPTAPDTPRKADEH